MHRQVSQSLFFSSLLTSNQRCTMTNHFTKFKSKLLLRHKSFQCFGTNFDQRLLSFCITKKSRFIRRLLSISLKSKTQSLKSNLNEALTICADELTNRSKKASIHQPTINENQLTHHIDDESAAAGQLGNRMFGRIADIDGPECQLEDILLGPVRLDHDVPLPVDVRLRPPQFDCRVVRLVRMELHVHARRAGQLRLGISWRGERKKRR